MTVRFCVAVCHRIYGKHDVITQIVGAAGRRFHTQARCNSRQEHLSYAALAQGIIQGRADECAYSLLAHDVVARLLLQFGDKLSPLRRKRKLWRSGIRTARSPARHVDENHWQTSLAERACEA